MTSRISAIDFKVATVVGENGFAMIEISIPTIDSL